MFPRLESRISILASCREFRLPYNMGPGCKRDSFLAGLELTSNKDLTYMHRGQQFSLFCDVFAQLVAEEFDNRFYTVSDEAVRQLRRIHGQRLSKRFKDEEVILRLRAYPIRVEGRQGSINCDHSITGKRPKTGYGTNVSRCSI